MRPRIARNLVGVCQILLLAPFCDADLSSTVQQVAAHGDGNAVVGMLFQGTATVLRGFVFQLDPLAERELGSNPLDGFAEAFSNATTQEVIGLYDNEPAELYAFVPEVWCRLNPSDEKVSTNVLRHAGGPVIKP